MSHSLPLNVSERIFSIRSDGKCGYRLVSTEMASNMHDCTVMYFFFTKEIEEDEE